MLNDNVNQENVAIKIPTTQLIWPQCINNEIMQNPTELTESGELSYPQLTGNGSFNNLIDQPALHTFYAFMVPPCVSSSLQHHKFSRVSRAS